MPSLLRRSTLALLILVPGFAQMAPTQAAPRKYLAATSHYLKAEGVPLFALPAPPQIGTLAADADLETVLQVQDWRTAAQVAWADRIDHLDAFDAAAVLGPWFNRKQLPRCAQLLEEALGDGEAVNYVAKLRFKRLRPPIQDPRVQPCTPVQRPTSATPSASFYSYPSGHATSIYLMAEILGELVPARQAEVQAWAHKAAWSRIVAGVHFPSDDLGGHILAGIIVQSLKANPAFVAALEDCREEVRAVQTAR